MLSLAARSAISLDIQTNSYLISKKEEGSPGRRDPSVRERARPVRDPGAGAHQPASVHQNGQLLVNVVGTNANRITPFGRTPTSQWEHVRHGLAAEQRRGRQNLFLYTKTKLHVVATRSASFGRSSNSAKAKRHDAS
jgi:hypothetical protein